ncbi:MAG: signal peptidase I, partial [Legionellales bacterium]|nr:signal peptidase I [Legionellales bacterium]
MNLNFALILIILVMISGVAIGLDKGWFAKRRDVAQARPKWIEWSYAFFPIFVIVLLIRSFAGELFRIPSGSLEPTLQVGDMVLVNKFQYGLKWPVVNRKFISVSEPQPGDIAVFLWPADPSLYYVKRVVGVPGDHIEYQNKQFKINGQPVEQTYVGEVSVFDGFGQLRQVQQWDETLNGTTYSVYRRPEVIAHDFELTVPPDHYFMIGDNRDDSMDSRHWG